MFYMNVRSRISESFWQLFSVNSAKTEVLSQSFYVILLVILCAGLLQK